MEIFQNVNRPALRKILLVFAVTLALVLLAFGRSLFQGFAPLDDDLLITHNLIVRGMTMQNIRAAFTTFDPELYIPLTFLSYQLDYLIGGLQPWIFHLTNIVLHALNAFVIWRILLRWTGRETLSLFAALLFAVHPLNTEAVVWAAARKDLLSTLLFLLSLLTYLHYREGRRYAYIFSIGLFLLALLAKVMTATLPLVLLLHDILLERRMLRRAIVDKIPYIALSAIFLIIATFGKERVLGNHATLETILMAGKSTVYYLQKFFLPLNLGVFYPYRGPIGLTVPSFLVPGAIVATLSALALAVWKKFPWVTFGWFFFLLTLAPTFLNFHKGGEIYFASDRYPYLPSLGLLFLLAIALSRLPQRLKSNWLFLGIPVIAVLAFLSFRQTFIWDSAEALFNHTLRLYPHSIASRVGLSSIERRTGHEERAIAMAREGLQYGESVQLRVALGTAYAKVGRVEDAVDQFEIARRNAPLDPDPLYALASLDEHFGQTEAAMEKLRKAVELDPSFVAARNKLGAYLLEKGKTAEAEEQFREALRWNPNTEGVHYNLATILEARGEHDVALDHLEKANALLPDDLRIMLALAKLLLERDPHRARELLERMLKIDGQNREAREMLSRLGGRTE